MRRLAFSSALSSASFRASARASRALLSSALLAGGACEPSAASPKLSTAPAAATPPPPSGSATLGRPPLPPIAASELATKHPRCVVAIDLAALRATPLAREVDRLLARSSPWAEMGDAIDPVAGSEWAVYASPTPHANPQSAYVLRVAAPPGAVDRAMVAASRATSGERFETGVRSVVGVHAIVDETPHVALRKGDSLLAVVPEDGADAIARTLDRAKIEPGFAPSELARASLRRPYTTFAALPITVQDASARATRSRGAIRVEIALVVPIEQEAIVVARSLQRELGKPSDVRRVLGDLADRVVIEARETAVRISLEADDAELAQALARVP